MWNIYIISVPSVGERRAHALQVKDKLTALGCNVQIIDGLYYKQFDVIDHMCREGLTYDVLDKSVSLSQIGCFLSHRIVWKLIAAGSESDYHVVLEDDMDLCDDFSLPEIESRILSDYDCFYLWKHPFTADNQKAYLVNSFVSTFYKNWGTCAYMIRPSIARYMLNNLRAIVAPIDIMMITEILPKIKTYISVKDYFINKGYIGDGDNGKYVFKSLIWG